MAIRAVVFDVGNVLELTEDNYPFDEWAARLGLTSEQFAQRTAGVFAGADIGAVTLDEVHKKLGEALGTGARQVSTLMEEFWREYLRQAAIRGGRAGGRSACRALPGRQRAGHRRD